MPVLAAAVLGAAACGTTKAPLSTKARAKPAAAKPAPGQPAVTAGGGSSCASARWASTVYGTPHISRDPTIEAVTVTPNFGGLLVSYRFKRAFVTAPAGVYDA